MAQSAKRLLLIGAKPGICDRALTLTDNIVLIHKPSAVDASLAAQMDETILLNYEKDVGKLLRVSQDAHRAQNFTAIVCQTEQGLIPAAEVGEALSLNPNPIRVVRETRDKVLMRQRLAESGFSPVAATEGKSRADVEAFAAKHGYPLIIKPRDGSASRGITRVSNVEELWAIAPGPGIDVPYIDGGDFIIEEFQDGPEFSVEAFSFNGHHTIFAITEKLILESMGNSAASNAYVEIGHKMPADIDANSAATICEHVRQFLTVMGIRNGPTHTELKLTSRGPKIIETHTRIGGDNIIDLVQLSTTYDLLQICLSWPLGLSEVIRDSPKAVQGAAIRYFTPKPGIVRRVYGTSAWRSAPGIAALELPLKPGDVVNPVRVSEDRVGYVIATGRTANDADALCRKVCESVVIESVKAKLGPP
jgi:biotin carboxylase